MSQFIQLHVLTFYPPSNLNRDDNGAPKSCIVGGRQRLRISSQCLKRSWRTSQVFETALSEQRGTRSKRVLHKYFYQILMDHGVSETNARTHTESVSKYFAKLDNKEINSKPPKMHTSQLVHYAPDEINALQELARTLGEHKRKPTDEELNNLRGKGRGVDIAMFGRMLADKPEGNVDAAIQVSHAFSVNHVQTEYDYFTAIDDLNTSEDSGAAHLDETYFGSGLYYLYINIHRDNLLSNLGEDPDLMARALGALTEAVLTVSPSGKQNSFAAQSPAAYVVVEKGSDTPRSLALSFMEPVKGSLLDQAVEQLNTTRDNLNKAYGYTNASYTFAPLKGEGTLSELKHFITEVGK